MFYTDFPYRHKRKINFIFLVFYRREFIMSANTSQAEANPVVHEIRAEAGPKAYSADLRFVAPAAAGSSITMFCR